MASLVHSNPAAAYELYSDERALDFLQTHFEPRVVGAYCSLIPGAFRADLLRLGLLYVYGGVYCDLGNTCLTNLEEQLEREGAPEYLFVKDCWVNPKALHNGFIYARRARSELMKVALEDVVQRVEARTLRGGMFVPTGPEALAASVRKFMHLEPNEAFQDANPHQIGFWSFDVVQRAFFDAQQTKMFTYKYSGYSSERTSPHYSTLWNFGYVYR